MIDAWEEAGERPPRCPRCGAWLRPDVVWFGELLPLEALREAEQAAARCDLFFSIGTSALVYPAAQLPRQALRGGAAVVEINPEPTLLSERAAFSLRGAAGELLPRLLREAWGVPEARAD